MGCTASKGGTDKISTRDGKKSWGGLLQPATPNPAEQRLAKALQKLKRKMDEDQCALEAFTFTKIILKLGTIERVLRRIKVVFQSVDHGNKGHVTKEELKEGLHKAKVDLGEEWKDTNIDECLEHLRGGGANQDEVGLREFVVMLAVGRVCRPLEQRSSVFVPLNHGRREEAREDEAQRKEILPMKTINEREARESSMMSGSLNAVAAAAAASNGEVTMTSSGGPAGDGKKEQNGTTSSGGGCGRGGGVDCVGGDGAGAKKVPNASAGIGGLPQGHSWTRLKWARIPALRNVDGSGQMDGSGRSMRSLTRALSGSTVSFTKRPPSASSNLSAGSTDSGGGGGGGGGVSSGGVGGGGDGESEVSLSVKYVLDLFIAAYFQFDTTGRGFIKKGVLEKNLRKAERESGGSALLDQRRWSELAWDGDRLSFQEFMYAFAQWLGLLEDDDVDDQDPFGRPSKNGLSANNNGTTTSANATAKAIAIAEAKGIADALAKASANANANANATFSADVNGSASANANATANAIGMADAKTIANAVSKTNAGSDAVNADAGAKTDADTDANASANSNPNASPSAGTKAIANAKNNAILTANSNANASATANTTMSAATSSSPGREAGGTSVSAGASAVAAAEAVAVAGVGVAIADGEEQRPNEKREEEEAEEGAE